MSEKKENHVPAPAGIFEKAMSPFLASRKNIHTPRIKLGHQIKETNASPLVAMLLTPDEKYLITGGYDGKVRIYDYQGSGRLIHCIHAHNGWVSGLAYRNGVLLSGGHDYIAISIDVAAGRILCRFKGHGNVVHALDFSPGGLIATGSRDGSIRIWDLQTGKWRNTFPVHRDSVRTIVWRADTGFIYSGSDDGMIIILDPVAGIIKKSFRAGASTIHNLSFNKKGQMLTGSSDGYAKVYDQNGHLEKQFTANWAGVRFITANRDCSKILTANLDFKARVFDVYSEACGLVLDNHSDWVRSAWWSGNERVVMTASKDGSVCYNDSASGECLGRLYNIDRGFLYTASKDSVAGHGWVYTDREDLVEVFEYNTKTGHKTFLGPEDFLSKEYLSIYNTPKILQKLKIKDGDDTLEKMVGLKRKRISVAGHFQQIGYEEQGKGMVSRCV